MELGWPTRATNSGGQLGRAAKVAHGGHKVPIGGLTNGGCEKDFIKNLLTNPLKHPLENPLDNFLKNPLTNRLNGGHGWPRFACHLLPKFWLAGWLVGWLLGCLVGWLVGWLVGDIP